MVKDESAAHEDRTHFVLVTKPKFIKVEGGNEVQPASPRKIQNVTLEAEEDDDIALMKSSQSSDEGTSYYRQKISLFDFLLSPSRHSTQTL